jgi:hypothetical protein
LTTRSVALANGRIIINAGGGPTDDKPTVTLQTPHDLDRVSGFLVGQATSMLIPRYAFEYDARRQKIIDAIYSIRECGVRPAKLALPGCPP